MCNKVKEYWKKFCEEKNIPEDTKYEAWSFGNTKEMADELGDLVKLLQLELMNYTKKMRKFQKWENTILF